MSIDLNEISNLAKVLHENGDKILNGASKLSLEAALLQLIGPQFENICDSIESNSNGTFEVLSPLHGQSDTLHHLQFLHDFFQKTVGLKVVKGANVPLSEEKIDLSKFKNLKFLELKRIPVKQVVGLKVVQPLLECIICERGLTALEEIFAACGGDNSTGFVWSELREAVLSFNRITVVDTSVAFAPWLQVLDLSHNQICDVNAIACLPNLKYVNLSFNSLSTIPLFNKSSRKKLEVLVLKNNYIENLNALSGLDHLTELDLSNNWICHANVFQPFLSMSTLHWLSLKGNPVCGLPLYRLNLIGYLHISASFGDFVLDGTVLNKKERSRVGIELISKRSIMPNQPANIVASTSSQIDDVVAPKEKPARKSGKARLAPIPNLGDGTYDEAPSSDFCDLYVQESKSDHLATKALIEKTRKEHGEDWLRCKAADVVSDLLGLPSGATSSTPYDDACLVAFLNDSSKNIEDDEESNLRNNVTTTTAIIEPIPKDLNVSLVSTNAEESFLSCKDDTTSMYFSVNNSNEVQRDTKEPSPDIETIQDPGEEKDDNEERLFIVVKLTPVGDGYGREEVFLSLTPTELRERNVIHGRTIGSWSLESLESATRMRERILHLVFDTIRWDRRERFYELIPEEVNELYDYLRTNLEGRTLAEMKQLAFRCMACSSVFVIEKKHRKSDVPCPLCGSGVVLQENEVPFPSAREEKTSSSVKSNRSHTRSASTGVMDGLKSEQIKKCSSQSSIGSANSLDDKRDITPPILKKGGKKCESDIEIISNPSQSSIEVIDTPLRTQDVVQVFKSEERPPALLTQVTSAFSGLTESSSSGSVTDSVCTAYENNSMVSSSASKKSMNESSPLIEEPATDACTKESLAGKEIETLLEEAMENVGGKVSKSARRKAEDKDIDVVDYSFDNFDQIDHRIKLYLYVHLFEDNSEEFSFLIRCQILNMGASQSYEGCVVASNKRLYVLKITGREEGEEASKFLTKVDSIGFSLSKMKNWHVLPWYHGFLVAYKSGFDRHNEFLILLKDPTWTNNFIHFITSHDTLLPSHCERNTEPLTGPCLKLTQYLLTSAEDATLLNISHFSSCRLGETSDVVIGAEGIVIVTPTDLFIINSVTWMLPSSKTNIPSPIGAQKLGDLIQVGLNEGEIHLQFLQEAKGRQELWCLKFASESVISNFIAAIRTPWEELFSVPLHVTEENIAENNA